MGPGQGEALATVLDFRLPDSCFPDPVWVLAGVSASEEASAGGLVLAAAEDHGGLGSAASVDILILQ